MRFRILASALLLVTFCLAQSPTRFEIVSIKPNISGSGSSSSGTRPGGRFSASNVSVEFLIQEAFDVQSYQVVGAPDWTSSVKYDIEATTGRPERSTPEEALTLLQSMLADRFGFRYHKQMKETPVYSLNIAKSGAKLIAHTGDGGRSIGVSSSGGKTTVTAKAIQLSDLVTILGRQVGRTVVDKTGMAGKFDLTLEWVREPTLDNPGATVFTAVQEQLGLRLDSDKAPVEAIVVDAVQQASAN